MRSCDAVIYYCWSVGRCLWFWGREVHARLDFGTRYLVASLRSNPDGFAPSFDVTPPSFPLKLNEYRLIKSYAVLIGTYVSFFSEGELVAF